MSRIARRCVGAERSVRARSAGRSRREFSAGPAPGSAGGSPSEQRRPRRLLQGGAFGGTVVSSSEGTERGLSRAGRSEAKATRGHSRLFIQVWRWGCRRRRVWASEVQTVSQLSPARGPCRSGSSGGCSGAGRCRRRPVGCSGSSGRPRPASVGRRSTCSCLPLGFSAAAWHDRLP